MKMNSLSVSVIQVQNSEMTNEVKMIRNKNYKTDYKYAMGLCNILLRITGSWPEETTECSFNYISSTLLTSITFFVMVAFISPMILEMLLTKISTYQLLLIISFLIWFGIAFVEFIIFSILKHKLVPLLKIMQTDWMAATPEHRQIMLQRMKTGRIMTIFCVTFMYMGTVSWNYKGTTQERLTVDNETYFLLTYPGNFVWVDAHRAPYYYVLATIQPLGCFFGMTIVVNTLSMAVCLISHLTGQYEILYHEITTYKLPERNDKDLMQNFISKIVKRHVHLKR